MIGYDHTYGYPVQVEVIDRGRSYTSGCRTRAEALASARKAVTSKHAGTILAGRECAVIVHTEYASRIMHRPHGVTDRQLQESR